LGRRNKAIGRNRSVAHRTRGTAFGGNRRLVAAPPRREALSDREGTGVV